MSVRRKGLSLTPAHAPPIPVPSQGEGVSVRPHLTLFTPFSLQGNNFELGAVTVDPQTSSYDPHPLIEYLAALKLPYFYEEQGMVCFVQLCVVL